MAKFVTLKRGGQPGHVAINVELVTDIRSSLGPFTDVFCGDHQITVDGTFEHVVALMSGTLMPKAPPAGPFARIA